MNKFWKIFAISLGSLVGLVLIVIVVALWLVFTPARLTPIVEKQLPRFITCPAEVERVELTFFSSFPRLGLRVDGVNLVNPMEGAPCDTLVSLDRLNAAVDVKAFLRRDELILSDIELHGGKVCLYADSLGRTNYDIVKSEPDADTTSTAFAISRIDVDRLTLRGLDVRYVDDTAPMDARLAGLSGTIGAKMNGDDIAATVVFEPLDVDFSMGRADSMMTATLRGLGISLTASMKGDAADADLELATAGVTFAYGGAEYLKDGVLSLTANAGADIPSQKATIRNATLKLGDLEIALDGTVQNDTLRGIDTDLHYKFAEWPLDKVLALVPASFAHYLDGIDAAGVLSSEGTVKGLYGKESMPMIDAGVTFADGRVAYPAMLPWPLTGVSADLAVHTDLSDAVSSVTVKSLSARAPHSTIKAHGTVDRLFSDPHANLTADVNADLADAKPFLPKDMPIAAAGKVSGRVRADARMSQLTTMALDKMRLSGSLLVSGLDATYDTIIVNTPSAKLDFALPNAKPATPATKFASLDLVADKLAATMGGGTTASLDGTKLSLEISDVLDSQKPLAAACGFAFANLTARMDDMSVEATAPSGKVSMEPGRRDADVQRYNVVLNSGRLAGKMGDMNAAAETLGIDASVSYDTLQNNIWQQLSPRGKISAGGVTVNVPSLNYPVEVPALAMDFTPRQFHIGQARVKLDESDFSLDGTIDNIDAYFRGDDILRADLNFNSPVTNISQLLALTSGLGDEQLEAEKTADTSAPDEFTGPYMVPKGIDLTLHTDMEEMLWQGKPLFSNVRGEIWIKDGVMRIAPDLTFDSPVTHGEFWVMYKTPDKNNLFAGLSLHLDRIEMEELVDLIPDVDNFLPMLRGFSGEGEFHVAAEGYMDSTYRFKKSTLFGAGSVAAVNLKLKDEELFRKIAFLLKYKDERALRIDSMRAEFSIFRNEIELYPFLLKLDRYGAVISGFHNTNMNFNYNISLVESPLPFRAAVDVTGVAGDLKFKVFSKSKYPDFYRPKYNGVTENREMEIRNRIRDSLLEGRKEEESEE